MILPRMFANHPRRNTFATAAPVEQLVSLDGVTLEQIDVIAEGERQVPGIVVLDSTQNKLYGLLDGDATSYQVWDAATSALLTPANNRIAGIHPKPVLKPCRSKPLVVRISN
jgi:hypothetical protein